MEDVVERLYRFNIGCAQITAFTPPDVLTLYARHNETEKVICIRSVDLPLVKT